MTKGEQFYEEHAGFLGRGDVDGLLEAHYHDDVEMVTFEFVLRGKEAIKRYMTQDSPAKMGNVLGVTTVKIAESDDVIIFTAQVKSEKLGLFVARDAFYLVDGKIKRHIALTLPPEEDRALYSEP